MIDLRKYIADKPTPRMDVKDNPNVVTTMTRVLSYLPTREEIIGDVLDIGPGRGWEIGELERRYPGRRVSVVTFFEEEAVVLRDITRDDVLVCDMHELPAMWTDRFGLVFASLVLDHSPAPYIALCEWTRVLKTGGKMFLSTPKPGDFTGLSGEWPSRLGDFTEHVFSASFDTTLELIRHVPKGKDRRNGLAGLFMEAYHEVPHICNGRVEYWRRIWKLRKR